MDITKITEYLSLQWDLRQELAEVVGYSQPLDCDIDDWRDQYWYQDGDRLLIFNEHPPENWLSDDWLEDADFWEYTISSYSAKGERFFQGKQDDYVFIMAYPENLTWNQANILVFHNELKITDEKE